MGPGAVSVGEVALGGGSGAARARSWGRRRRRGETGLRGDRLRCDHGFLARPVGDHERDDQPPAPPGSRARPGPTARGEVRGCRAPAGAVHPEAPQVRPAAGHLRSGRMRREGRAVAAGWDSGSPVAPHPEQPGTNPDRAAGSSTPDPDSPRGSRYRTIGSARTRRGVVNRSCPPHGCEGTCADAQSAATEVAAIGHGGHPGEVRGNDGRT